MITILVLILSTNLNAQQKNSTSEKEIDDIMKWHVLRQRVEKAVDRGKLNRIEADKEYSNFRAKMNGRRIDDSDESSSRRGSGGTSDSSVVLNEQNENSISD